MVAFVGCPSLETRWSRRGASGLGVVDATNVGMADFAIFAVWERVLLAGGWLGQFIGLVWAARKRLYFDFCAAALVILLCVTWEWAIVGMTFAVAVVMTCAD